MINSTFPYSLKVDHTAGRLPTSTSKVYMSSKDVLHGDWVQVGGDGAEIDAKEVKLFDVINVKHKHGDLYADDQSDFKWGNQVYNYTIKIKWE